MSSQMDPETGDTDESYVKTPLFAASNSARYERQRLIRQIQAATDSRLICYVCGDDTQLEMNDVLYFRDLLRNIPENSNIDLLLHTDGGHIDAVEKLWNMIRDRTGDAIFRVIVPDRAKSAGTLLALGASQVMMSDSSDLGPIDPQVPRIERNGQITWISVQHYLDAYNAYADRLSAEPSDPVAALMLDKFDPVVRESHLGVNNRARQLAEKLLRRGMFSTGAGNITKVASKLLDTRQWHTHSHVISWRDAKDIGLRVAYLDPHDGLWQQYWYLFCHQRLELDEGQKLFESDYVYLIAR